MGVKLTLTGRTATQSSTYADYLGNYVASLAIDGNYNTYLGAGHCSHTNDPPLYGTSWWRVDLGQPVKVQRVMIANRGDGAGKRHSTFDTSVH